MRVTDVVFLIPALCKLITLMEEVLRKLETPKPLNTTKQCWQTKLVNTNFFVQTVIGLRGLKTENVSGLPIWATLIKAAVFQAPR